MSKQGVVNIRGKQYKTVVLRVNEFREKYKPEDGWSIQTWLITDDGDRVVTRTVICDKDDHIVATGLAEEVRASSNINKTSAVENCETSSLGRALSAFGYAGEEYCSADELVRALERQEAQPDSNPVPKPQSDKPAPKPKPNPVERLKKYLGLLEELIGEEATKDAWLALLRHSDHSSGSMSLGDVINRCSVTQKFSLSEELKEVYLANVKLQSKKEQPELTEEEPF